MVVGTRRTIPQNGLLSGSGGATIGIEGSTNVNDVFMEASIPLVQDQPFAEQLSFDTAYRYSDYNSGIQTDTYKFGMDWAPVQDIRFRASFQRAVRAPNIVELFTAQGFNLFDMDGDPCGAAVQFPEVKPGQPAPPPPAASLQECVATGVPDSQFGSSTLDSPAGQFNFNQGGNPDLKPETSDAATPPPLSLPCSSKGSICALDVYGRLWTSLDGSRAGLHGLAGGANATAGLGQLAALCGCKVCRLLNQHSSNTEQ